MTDVDIDPDVERNLLRKRAHRMIEAEKFHEGHL